MKATSLSKDSPKASGPVGKEEEGVGRPDSTRWIVLLGIFILTTLLTSPFLLHKPPVPRVDDPSPPRGIMAQVAFSAELQSRRDAWERRREETHRRVWVYNPATGQQVLENLENILLRLMGYTLDGDPVETISRFRRDFPQLASIPDEQVAEAISVLQDRRMRDSLREIVSTAYSRHVVTAELPLFLEHRQRGILAIVNENQLPRFAANRPLEDRFLRFPMDMVSWPDQFLLNIFAKHYDGRPREIDEIIAARLLQGVIRPSLTRDIEATRRYYDGFELESFERFFTEGQWLIPAGNEGTPITAEMAIVLREHRRNVDRLHNYRLFGHAAYVLVLFLVMSFYVNKFSGELRFNTQNTLLIGLPVVLALSVQYVAIMIAEGSYQSVGYLFPAGAIGMLAVLLLDVRMALLLVTGGSLLLGLQVDLNFEYVVVAIFGGYVAVAALQKLRKRWDAFHASILVGLANMAIIIILSFVENPLGTIPIGKAFIGFTGGIATFLVLAILPVIERFGIITDIQLLELSGLHHKLLRDMEEEAPGTWQHTLNVSKLAEAAATEIGVNYLLVRAGCYFHDIGKIKKPEFFTENQTSPEDKQRHDSLKPIMSARVIMNHVKEGTEMARQYGLPSRIIDFIAQHHGTSVIQFFHMKAQRAFENGETKEAPREEDYRYPGPKPQTIEAAIVMLADSVEATATAKLSSRKVREDEIRRIVYDTILDKFNDGQFDQCNLTLRDLTVIRQTFIRVLKSRFHTRIDYPKKNAPPPPPKKPTASDPKKRVSREGADTTEADSNEENRPPTQG